MVMIAKTTGELSKYLATYPENTHIYLAIDDDIPTTPDWYTFSIGETFGDDDEDVLLIWAHEPLPSPKV